MSDSLVANKRVRYTIWDTAGVMETNTTRTLAFREADVFLLCYKISDPSSLFSAINHWVPDLRQQAPSTPIVLVGCQSDLRTDRTSKCKFGKCVSYTENCALYTVFRVAYTAHFRGFRGDYEIRCSNYKPKFKPVLVLQNLKSVFQNSIPLYIFRLS